MPNIKPHVRHTTKHRGIYLRIVQTALEAVDPARCVTGALQRSGDLIRVHGRVFDLSDTRRVFVIGFGKAAAPMAQAVERVLGDRLTAGVVIVKEGHSLPTRRIRVLEAAHPVPDQRSILAATEVVRLARQAEEDDLVIVLISGGGSALLTLPATGITLDDIRHTTDILLKAGATINELNAVRKHLSAVKGGQLARYIAPAHAIGLVLSDVVGNRLDVIASGPLSPDPTTFADAWAVLKKYQLVESVPPRVRQRLQLGMQGSIPETPKPGDSLFERIHVVIVGDNARAAEAAARAAKEAGYNSQVLSTFVEGEAREVARVVAALGKEVRRYNRPVPVRACLVLGGETTVTVRGKGLGGRNQELALAAALALEEWPGITVVALGTDGTDGPTDAAGGMVDAGTPLRAREAGLDPLAHLLDNNAYPLLQAAGDLLITGPTRTNVNDLILIFVEAEGHRAG